MQRARWLKKEKRMDERLHARSERETVERESEKEKLRRVRVKQSGGEAAEERRKEFGKLYTTAATKNSRA